MEKDSKKSVVKGNFTTEYDEIINPSEKSVVVETQWAKKGDFFQKLSMYDNSYVLVKTLGSTTLIKAV